MMNKRFGDKAFLTTHATGNNSERSSLNCFTLSVINTANKLNGLEQHTLSAFLFFIYFFGNCTKDKKRKDEEIQYLKLSMICVQTWEK